MNFNIDSIDNIKVSDREIASLLSAVYVDTRLTTAALATKIFRPSDVRGRGYMLVARESLSQQFCGMIIVVPPESDAIALAQKNACEIHLLSVAQQYRSCGLGRKLVATAVHFAEMRQFTKIVLWTQQSMLEAQSLYESFGFVNVKNMVKNNIEFLVYEKNINPSLNSH